MTRKGSIKAGLLAIVLVLAGVAGAVAATTTVVAPTPAVAETINTQGLDLHDGTVQKFGSTYYMYGTQYGCGFRWGDPNGTTWCGFGVSSAPTLKGPWSTPKLLFSRYSINPWTGKNWIESCAEWSRGCFNPRMVQRTWGPKDGVYMLWFNAPADYTRDRSNAYYVMGCNGPMGGCGAAAGAPHGSTRKPPLYICSGNGDFSIVKQDPYNPYILCTMPDQTFNQEKLDYWGTSGTNVGARKLAGLTRVESPGAYRDAATGKWILTYSDPNCGYCAGNGTSYALATSLAGPWAAPVNTGASADVQGRRAISATSCGGQPRTVFTVDGQPYEWVDLWGVWNGDWANQTGAGVLFAPLNYKPRPTPNGGVLAPQFGAWPCA